MEAAAKRPPPDWDRQEVARPYLEALRHQLMHDAIEVSWLDGLLTTLSRDLRDVYKGQDADRAMEALDLLLEKYDLAELQRQAHNPSWQSSQILARWRRISRYVFAPSPPAQPQDSYNNQQARPAPQKQQTAPNAAATPQRLNGAAMRKSIVGTWMMLVIMSWAALFWDALFSLPFGLGAVGATAAFTGFFTIPLWGTFWGWLGMGGASAGVLRDMHFKAVPADHPLAVISGAFARDLGLPPPNIGTMREANAFAMGTSPRNATISIGVPLLETLNADEISAIIGHELGHVVSGDMRRMVLMRTFQNAIACVGIIQHGKRAVRWMVFFLGELMILASSRKREFYADAVGASLAGKEAMISALRKLETAPPLSSAERLHARFMARGKINAISNLFSTHPTFDARVRALENETFVRRLPRYR